MSDLRELLKGEKDFRIKQVYKAWFDPEIRGYEEITTLPLELRKKLGGLNWLEVSLFKIQESAADMTKKALLQLADGGCVETVLMGRKPQDTRECRYTLCVSTQVGCPMGCAFCATGKMGLKRDLSAQEIVDQYRFWRGSGISISNIVFMGQGEPLLNYENVKEAQNILIKYGEVGPSKITLSTCGVPAAMDKLVEDKDFPGVRLAISLHSAIEETRAKLMPSHQKGFFEFLVGWSKKYHQRFPGRALFIGLEYIMLSGVNDDQRHLKALIKLASKLGRIRINLIPYNSLPADALKGSGMDTIRQWRDALMKAGFVCTIRLSQGQDIAAACGQLANSQA